MKFDLNRIVLLLHATLLLVAFLYIPSESGLGPSGVLTALLSTGGHPNPPGYQTIGLIGELWNLIPHDNPFLHFNRLGFLIGCASLAAAAIFVRTCKPGAPTMAVVGLILVSATFQRHLFFFDRYLLAGAVMFLGLTEAAKIERSQTPISWLPLGIYLGLGFLSHLFAAIAIAVYAIFQISGRRWREIQSLVGLTVGFLFGLVPMIWSLYKGFQLTFFNWGEIRSWSALFNHISRQERGPLPVLRNFEKLERQLSLIGQEIASQFSGLGIPLALLAIGFLIWKIRDKGSRSLLVTTVAMALTALGLTNFSLGGPGSGIERTVGWYFANYFLFFHLLISVGLYFGMASLPKPAYQRIASSVILAFAAISMVVNFRPQTYPKILREMTAHFPQNSVVLTQTDSLYFPLEAARLNHVGDSGPILIHTHLLARSWYLRSLIREQRLAPELNQSLQKAATAFDQKSEGVAATTQDQVSLFDLINQIIAHYEKNAGAFLVEFEQFDPVNYSMFSAWSREPWGIGERLFRDNNETQEIAWSADLKSLFNPICHDGFKEWCLQMSEQYRSNFIKRMKLIAPIFPNEAEIIKTALRP